MPVLPRFTVNIPSIPAEIIRSGKKSVAMALLKLPQQPLSAETTSQVNENSEHKLLAVKQEPEPNLRRLAKRRRTQDNMIAASAHLHKSEDEQKQSPVEVIVLD